MPDPENKPFRTARDEDALSGTRPAEDHAAYQLAFKDVDFLLREDLRPVRFQLELLKPELLQTEQGVESTLVVFGSARLLPPEMAAERVAQADAALTADPDNPELKRECAVRRRIAANSRYYVEARKLAQLVSSVCNVEGPCDFVVKTGGGPGIMEAANRGAHDVGAKSIGLNIVLPFEQHPNPYITPELCFNFHYFAIRKMHFLLRAKAVAIFPGGFGTLDETFELLTLIQTRKMEPIPIVFIGRDFWTRVVDLDLLVDEGYVSPSDLALFTIVDSAEEAWEAIAAHHGIPSFLQKPSP
jgi:uncharacterized protein (TIGR00730 family)